MNLPLPQSEVNTNLRDRLSSGATLDDALRAMYSDDGIGMMSLWPAVMELRGVDRREAMKIAVRAISVLHPDMF